ETKGVHLQNEDTKYKQELFNLCNELAKEKDLLELGIKFKGFDIDYKVVFDKEWQNKLNQLFKE
ncbi:MAG: hypothetical protein ABID04_00285, partial [Patescibacteria group bacterium]